MSPVKKSTFRWSLALILIGGSISIQRHIMDQPFELLPALLGLLLAYLLVALGLSRSGV